MSKSQLTVILPVRNGEKFVAAAVASVLNQTFREFELWVLENGSDDGTAQIVRSIKDSRIKVFELGPVGVQGALQYGIENAPTEWLARMDADDLMFPNRLEMQMNFIKKNPRLVFAGTAHAILTPFGHIIERVLTAGTREVTKDLLVSNQRFFVDPSVVFNRYAALAAGGADFDFPNVDGVPLLFRLLTQGEGWEMAEHLHLYRLRPGSLSRNKQHREQARRVRLKYAPELIKTEPEEIRAQSVWQFIARLELLSGNTKSVRRAIDFMKRDGAFESEAKGLLWRSFLGAPGRIYYRWQNRCRYRHRSDWEDLFAPLLRLQESII
jgi:glycosyltransferase involved in cell wall biosynthesis